METGDTEQDGEQVSRATDGETTSNLVKAERASVPGRKFSQTRAWLEPWTLRNH